MKTADIRRFRHMLAAGIIIALVSAWCWNLGGGRPTRAPSTVGQQTTTPDVDERSLTTSHIPQPQRQSTTPSIHVDVVDSFGRPVPGAYVDVRNGEPRQWSPSEATQVTDTSGTCLVPCESNQRDSPEFLIAGKPVWLSASTRIESATTQARLVLERPHFVRANVVDSASRPLSGVRFALSRRSHPSSIAFTESIPGPAADALFCGVSGADGSVEIPCGEGTYALELFKDGFVTVSRPEVSRFETGMDYTFTMEPLVGIVARSVDGPITSWMFGEDVWQLFREPQPPSQSEWMRHRIRW